MATRGEFWGDSGGIGFASMSHKIPEKLGLSGRRRLRKKGRKEGRKRNEERATFLDLEATDRQG